MKKNIALLFLFILIQSIGLAQSALTKGIMEKLAMAENDTSRVQLMVEICNTYKFNRPDSALFYGNKAIALARKINYPEGEVSAREMIMLTQMVLGNYPNALKTTLQALKIAERNNFLFHKAILLYQLGSIYNQSKNYNKALEYFRESINLFNSLHDVTFPSLVQALMGDAFFMMNQPDSALYYCQLSYNNQLKDKWVSYVSTFNLGKIYYKIGNYKLALQYFRQSIPLTVDAADIFNSNLNIAKIYQQTDDVDSSRFYAEKSLGIARKSGIISNLVEVNVLLADIYSNENPKKALEYSKMAIILKDSLTNLGNETAIESYIDFDEKERQSEIETTRIAYKNQVQRIWIFSITGALLSALLVSLILYRNSKNKQKANKVLETTLSNLKSTQAQLIQSEKMASLGELTAGIAHEIQNPLNFVNNFSEVSKELLDEMKTEMDNGNAEDAKEIANDVIQNLEKINHHGKRADAIVKGMLQHSRTSSGVKEPTDINALADEYLRLSYHGLRAKEKDFNASIKTDFDETLPKINVIPQDIGRVLLNLINNAFYAVNEKVKTQHAASPLTAKEYEPTVSVSTELVIPPPGGPRGVKISIKDNGSGIPSTIKEKIFQPFFTTKPTGQGTGLGLSLSYDIVKAHGGEITVETKEGEGTEFIIKLPENA